jgi:hypothetical protein
MRCPKCDEPIELVDVYQTMSCTLKVWENSANKDDWNPSSKSGEYEVACYECGADLTPHIKLR